VTLELNPSPSGCNIHVLLEKSEELLLVIFNRFWKKKYFKMLRKDLLGENKESFSQVWWLTPVT
jgi:hypothetical protein